MFTAGFPEKPILDVYTCWLASASPDLFINSIHDITGVPATPVYRAFPFFSCITSEPALILIAYQTPVVSLDEALYIEYHSGWRCLAADTGRFVISHVWRWVIRASHKSSGSRHIT